MDISKQIFHFSLLASTQSTICLVRFVMLQLNFKFFPLTLLTDQDYDMIMQQSFLLLIQSLLPM